MSCRYCSKQRATTARGLNVSDPAACRNNSEPQKYRQQTGRARRKWRHGIVVPLAHALVSNRVEYECVDPSDDDEQHLDLESEIAVHFSGLGREQQKPGDDLNDKA